MSTRSNAVSPDEFQNVTARLPVEYHESMKREAKTRGRRTNDHYYDVISDFVAHQFDKVALLYATPRTAIPVSIPMRVTFVDAARSLSSAKGFTLNELIITAVARHLEVKTLAA